MAQSSSHIKFTITNLLPHLSYLLERVNRSKKMREKVTMVF